jgi:O-antigen/teichoic acid export membrane protein
MHHLVNVSRFAPDSILPILVTTLLSSADNAAFYIALLLSNYVTLVGQSATLTLFAVGARAPDELWQQLRTTMLLSVVAAVGGSFVLWLLGYQILGLFGEEYADTAYPAIALLAIRGVPILVKDHWVAIQRIRRGMGIAAILTWCAVGLEVGLAVVGTLLGGLEGLAIGWLIALSIQAVILAGPVIRAARSPREPSGEPA